MDKLRLIVVLLKVIFMKTEHLRNGHVKTGIPLSRLLLVRGEGRWVTCVSAIRCAIRVGITKEKNSNFIKRTVPLAASFQRNTQLDKQTRLSRK